MQTLHEDHLKTKASLKRREKNIDLITDKLFRQQSFMSRVFSDLRTLQTQKEGALELDMAQYELEFNKLNEELRAHHEKYTSTKSAAKQHLANTAYHRKQQVRTSQTEHTKRRSPGGLKQPSRRSAQ